MVPSIAAKILKENSAGTFPKINLKGLGIGDAFTSP